MERRKSLNEIYTPELVEKANEIYRRYREEMAKPSPLAEWVKSWPSDTYGPLRRES